MKIALSLQYSVYREFVMATVITRFFLKHVTPCFLYASELAVIASFACKKVSYPRALTVTLTSCTARASRVDCTVVTNNTIY